MAKERLKELDIMRAIAFIFVVAQHILGIYIALYYKDFKNIIIKFKWVVMIGYLSLLAYAYLNEIKVVEFTRSLYILFTIFTILGVYIICIYISNFENLYNKMKFVRDYSFAAYMAHIIVLNWMANYLQFYFRISDYLILRLLVWVITSIITPIMVYFLNCLQYSQYVTGAKSGVIKDI